MEDMYCYICGEIQKVEKEHPRYDCDDYGGLEITDITCCKCKRRFRLRKRVDLNKVGARIGSITGS